jgi:hypothetical protein
MTAKAAATIAKTKKIAINPQAAGDVGSEDLGIIVLVGVGVGWVVGMVPR